MNALSRLWFDVFARRPPGDLAAELEVHLAILCVYPDCTSARKGRWTCMFVNLSAPVLAGAHIRTHGFAAPGYAIHLLTPITHSVACVGHAGVRRRRSLRVLSAGPPRSSWRDSGDCKTSGLYQAKLRACLGPFTRDLACHPVAALCIRDSPVVGGAGPDHLGSGPGHREDCRCASSRNPARTPLATLAPGTSVTVVSVEPGWLEIAFEDQRYGRRVGYVPRSTVNFTLPAAARPVAAAKPPEPVTPPPARAAVRPVEDQWPPRCLRRPPPSPLRQSRALPCARSRTSFSRPSSSRRQGHNLPHARRYPRLKRRFRPLRHRRRWSSPRRGRISRTRGGVLG